MERAERPRTGSRVDPGDALLALYPTALVEVYGYLLHRVGGAVPLAEDICSEVFLAAADSARRGSVADLSVAWLIGIARHKLADHWRAAAREERRVHAVSGLLDDAHDPWDRVVDVAVARAALAEVGAHHRSALVFRYVDGLSVREVAGVLGRTEQATEQLLVRARAALRDVLATPVEGDAR